MSIFKAEQKCPGAKGKKGEQKGFPLNAQQETSMKPLLPRPALVRPGEHEALHVRKSPSARKLHVEHFIHLHVVPVSGVCDFHSEFREVVFNSFFNSILELNRHSNISFVSFRFNIFNSVLSLRASGSELIAWVALLGVGAWSQVATYGECVEPRVSASATSASSATATNRLGIQMKTQ